MKVINNIEILSPKGGFPERAAEEIRKKLAEYKPPKNIIKRTGKKGLQDVEEEWLILVCGPAAQNDPEVIGRVGEYIRDGKREKILALLAEGHSKESFPKELYYEIRPDGTRVDREPLGANITADSEGKALRNIEIEKLRLLAPMLGVAFDDLLNRKRRQRRLVITAILAAVFLCAFTFLGFAIYKFSRISAQNKVLSDEFAKAEDARLLAEQQRDAAKRSLAESAALKAREALEEGDTELSLLIVLEFLPEMQNVKELTDVFEEALRARCALGYVPLTTKDAYSSTRHRYLAERPKVETRRARDLYGIVSRKDDPLEEEKEAIVDQAELPITDYQYAYGFDDVIIGMSKDGVCVFRKDPFECLYAICDKHTREAACAPNGSTYWNSFFTAALPNGERRFVVDYQYVYDAKDGAFLYEIEDNGQDIGISRGFIELSSDGYLPLRIGDALCLIDLTDGHRFAEMPDIWRAEFTLFGDKEEESGRTSAEVICMWDYFQTCPDMIWVRNDEEIPIPDGMDRRIALAKELLEGRTLTEKERRDNSLE